MVEINGTWRSRGYGWILEVDGDAVRRFDETALGRIETDVTTLDGFRREHERIRRHGDRLELFEACGITRYEFDRVTSADGSDVVAATDDPLVVFDVLWQTFLDHYAFFERRGVDWGAVRRDLRPRLHPGSSDADLRGVLADALARLVDGHVKLRVSEPPRPPDPGLPGSVRAHLATMREWMRTDAAERPRSFGNGQVVAGWVGAGIGYVAALRMERCATDPSGPCEEVAAADAALRAALDLLDGARAMIVDVRANTGGWDAVALAMAARFAAAPAAILTKRARDGDGYTDPQTIWLTPADGPRYAGPTVALIGGSTASAAEVFTLALQRQPQVTLLGAPTRGILSDELEKRLPNGWTVSLSNEVYRAMDGTCPEGSGIPPDIELAPGIDEPVETELARGLAAAIATLGGGGPGV